MAMDASSLRRSVERPVCGLVALVEGFLAYRSSRTAWAFDTPEAQNRRGIPGRAGARSADERAALALAQPRR